MSDHPGYPPLGPGAGPDAALPTPKVNTEALDPPALGSHRLTCPLCGCQEFEEESGSLNSDFGMSAHRVDIRICVTCAHVLLFSKGRSWFWYNP